MGHCRLAASDQLRGGVDLCRDISVSAAAADADADRWCSRPARQHIRCRQTGLLDASDVLFASSERGRRQDCYRLPRSRTPGPAPYTVRSSSTQQTVSLPYFMVWRLVRYASRSIILSIMSLIAHLGKYSTLNHRKLLMCV